MEVTNEGLSVCPNCKRPQKLGRMASVMPEPDCHVVGRRWQDYGDLERQDCADATIERLRAFVKRVSEYGCVNSDALCGDTYPYRRDLWCPSCAAQEFVQ